MVRGYSRRSWDFRGFTVPTTRAAMQALEIILRRELMFVTYAMQQQHACHQDYRV